jgi:hypothetical protein
MCNKTDCQFNDNGICRYGDFVLGESVVWKKDRPRNEMRSDFDYSVPYATRESEVQGG